MAKELSEKRQLKIAEIMTSLSKNEIKVILLFLYFVVFQVVISTQLPFTQVEMVFEFYCVMIVLFSHHFFIYFKNINENIWSYMIDFSGFIFLMKSHPSLMSFNLVVLLVLVFIAGSFLNFKKTLFLITYLSVSLSIINLLSLKWSGAQNFISLVLFNFSFFLVGYIASHFKNQIADIKQEVQQVSRKLKSQEELAQSLIKYLPLGVSAFNNQSEVMFANNNISAELNLNTNDLVSIHEQTKNIQRSEVHFYNTSLQEKRIYDVIRTQFYDEDLEEKVRLLLLSDVTQFKNLQDQLRQKEKLAAIGQLAAGIAHEIRNPLASISGSIELLSSETKNPDDQKLMKIVLKEIDRLNNLITEFLDYSKPAVRPDQKVDLALIMNEVIQQIKLNGQLVKNLELDVQVESSFIIGFADQLRQAFLNIIINALQAMQKNPIPKIVIIIKKVDQSVVVSIKDFGSGMTDEVKKRIFEPFFTTKSKGTGLGLAITHKVFETHEAFVEIQSEINKGTEFNIKFKSVS